MSVVDGVDQLRLAGPKDALYKAEAQLKTDPQSVEAANAKLRALFALERWDTAAKFGLKHPHADRVSIAYALYRVGNVGALRNIPDGAGIGIILSKAQAEYKAGNLSAARKLLEEAESRVSPEDRADISTNKQAIRALEGDVAAATELPATTEFDRHFNIACALLEAHRPEEALESLAIAKVEANDDEDSAATTIQAAYAHQLLGHDEEALKLLQALPDADIVARNNLVSLQKPKDAPSIHESLVVYDDLLKVNVNAGQRAVLDANRLLLRHRARMNILRASMKHVSEFPYSQAPAIISKSPKSDNFLVNVQQLAETGDTIGAARLLLKHIDLTQKLAPGLAAAATAALKILGRPSTEVRAQVLPGYRGLATSLSHAEPEFFEGLGDSVLRAAGKCICDPAQASTTDLPPVADITAGLDVSELERESSHLFSTGGSRRLRTVQKRKRSGKTRLPKDFDPERDAERKPNPERWLPKQDRSDYKPPKKARKTQASQGAVEQDAAAASSVSSAPASKASKTKNKKKKGKK